MAGEEKPEPVSRSVDPWGTFKLRHGQAGRWRFGPSTVWIRRTPKEWLVAVHTGRDYLSTESEVTLTIGDDEWPRPDEAEFTRYAFSETRNLITLWPELSPISVVFTPGTPVLVSPGEYVTLYVSTPLWVRMETGDPPVLLGEFPTFRPSDTWFGPSSLEGEHCYAVKMSGRLQIDEVPSRVHRAITPIQIRNRASEMLSVENVRLPVQLLSLYRAADGMLWTQPVILEREADGSAAVLHLKEQFEPGKTEFELVRAPREEDSSGLVVRAWHWFFQKMKEI